jgi:hypothetical protein
MQNVKQQYGGHPVISIQVRPIIYLQQKAINNSDPSKIRSYGRLVIWAQHANHELSCNLQTELKHTRSKCGVTVILNKQANETIFLSSSPQANYTDWVTAAGRWILVPTFADRVLSCGQPGSTPLPLISVSRPEPLFFISSGSIFIPTRLSGPHFRAIATQKIW